MFHGLSLDSIQKIPQHYVEVPLGRYLKFICVVATPYNLADYFMLQKCKMERLNLLFVKLEWQHYTLLSHHWSFPLASQYVHGHERQLKPCACSMVQLTVSNPGRGIS